MWRRLGLGWKRKRLVTQVRKRSRPGKGYTFADVTRLGHEIRSIDDELYEQEGFALERTARKLEVDISQTSFPDYWEDDDGDHPRYSLSTKGRFNARKLIDEEKARRFEVKTLWVTKLIVPLLAALVGILGALTGLVAVLRHTK